MSEKVMSDEVEKWWKKSCMICGSEKRSERGKPYVQPNVLCLSSWHDEVEAPTPSQPQAARRIGVVGHRGLRRVSSLTAAAPTDPAELQEPIGSNVPAHVWDEFGLEAAPVAQEEQCPDCRFYYGKHAHRCPALAQGVELPPLNFHGHGFPICDCDLVGGDSDCSIQPPYKSAYDQRCDQLKAALAKLQAAEQQIEMSLDEELGRWQKTIYNLLQEEVPEANVDGGGCDSGDALDFSISEIGQGISYLKDKLVALERDNEMMKGLLREYRHKHIYGHHAEMCPICVKLDSTGLLEKRK